MLRRAAALRALHVDRVLRRPGRDRADAHAPARPPPRIADAGAPPAQRRRASHHRRHARSHRRGAARDRQRDEHLVDPDRANAELAVRQRSVLPLLLQRSGRRVRLPRTAGAEPRLRRDRVAPTATSSPTTTSSIEGVEVTVTMPDKRELRAKVIGADEATDIAVLKIDAREPADDAVGRFVEVEGRRVGAGDRQSVSAESDASPSASSARPAARLEGRSRPTRISSRPTPRSIPATPAARWSTPAASWSGINTAIFSETGGYQGIGFAVPSNLARHVMDELVKYGEVQRGTIAGITLAAADHATRRAARCAQHARDGRRQHAAALGCLRRGMRPGDIDRQLQRDDTSRISRISCGCCRTRRSAAPSRSASFARDDPAADQSADRQVDGAGDGDDSLAQRSRRSRAEILSALGARSYPTAHRSQPRRTAIPTPRRQ